MNCKDCEHMLKNIRYSSGNYPCDKYNITVSGNGSCSKSSYDETKIKKMIWYSDNEKPVFFK